MKAAITVAIAATLFPCPIAFFLYGGTRAMCETVGLNTRAIVAGLLVGVVFPALTGCAALFVVRIWMRLRPTTLFFPILAIGIGLSTGSILSEWWIIIDENKFVSEVREAGSEMPYSRARAWPNEGCSLVYIPDQGIHATD